MCSPNANAISKAPIPEPNPFMTTISKGSFTDSFLVQLFSNPQQEETLTIANQKEIDRLQVQVELWKKGLTDILTLAEELKMGTIEKVMQTSDLELGIEYLKKFF